MSKLDLTSPVLIMVYGYPGSGKTYFSRQLCEDVRAAHIQSERIRYELFEEPRYDKQENEIVRHLMDYMTDEFLAAGLSVVYDINAMRMSQRRELREVARKADAKTLLIWIQIDMESAFTRASKRDKRRIDDRYSLPIERPTFDTLAGAMQNPMPNEEIVVISGKHNYQTQRASVLKKLYDMRLVSTEMASSKMVKPGLVNLVPTPVGGRVDQSRRNISIR